MWRVLVFVLIIITSEAGKLPSYITQCKKSDPKFEACVVRAANLAIPLLAKGDRHYDIPKMNPLKLAHAVLKYDKDLKFILYDVEVHGIPTANFTHATLDLEAGKGEFVFNIPRLTVLASHYELNGRLLNITMFGNGFANITLVGGKYRYEPSFETTSDEFEQKFELGEHVMTYTTQRTIYDLENLYSGYEYAGFDMNSIINQYWKEVAKVLRPPASQIMGDFITLINKNLANVVSAEQFFEEK